MADYYRDQDISNDIKCNSLENKADKLLHAYKLGVLKWVPEDLNPVLVTHMSDTHIVNVHKHLNKVEKKDAVINMWIEIFGYEIIKRKLDGTPGIE